MDWLSLAVRPDEASAARRAPQAVGGGQDLSSNRRVERVAVVRAGLPDRPDRGVDDHAPGHGLKSIGTRSTLDLGFKYLETGVEAADSARAVRTPLRNHINAKTGSAAQ